MNNTLSTFIQKPFIYCMSQVLGPEGREITLKELTLFWEEDGNANIVTLGEKYNRRGVDQNLTVGTGRRDEAGRVGVVISGSH